MIVKKLHHIGTTGERLLYLDNRLKHRKTFVEWDHRVLGPINDEQGFEQGGISSGDLYTVYNADQLSIPTDAGLGVNLEVAEISSIGQADDVVLLSTDITLLNNLLRLTLDYCATHHVILAPEKTKLMAFSSFRQKLSVDYQKAISPININNADIEFVNDTEHVGIVRSVHGNLPHIQQRVTAHTKKLFALLPSGLARNQHLNPAASLRIQSLHANPVLLSGVAALCLNNSEMTILHSNHKQIIQSLQKLHDNTPECFIMFMGGTLGATATVHVRQLALFGMICRLPENVLNKIAAHKLHSEPDNSPSWFVEIRHLCKQYSLPSPLFLLANPPPKSSYKSLVKKRVVDFWQHKYRSDAQEMDSLKYFKPQYMSLLQPHPLWSTCLDNPYEVNKSIAVAKMMSGRYRSDWHCRHWSLTNKEGHCLLCPGEHIPGNIEHLLVSCRALTTKRNLLFNFWNKHTEESPHLKNLFTTMKASSTSDFIQFVIDPSAIPIVISGCQEQLFSLKEVFHLTRTFCYGIHRRRLQLLGRFNYA